MKGKFARDEEYKISFTMLQENTISLDAQLV